MLNIFRQIIRFRQKTGKTVFLLGPVGEAHGDVLKQKFFFPEAAFKRIKGALGFLDAFTSSSVILYKGVSAPFALRVRGLSYNCSEINNPGEGWDWIYAAAAAGNHRVDRERARENFERLRDRIAARDSSAIVYGTGPSLSSPHIPAPSDCIRIVCNTAGKDPNLWERLSPDVIVAGDGIYHFGPSRFAESFRRDLKLRLAERPAFFAYPSAFDYIVQREFQSFRDLLIPLDIGNAASLTSLRETFTLPPVDNVLNLLLLPMACALSKRVKLWGFDGRAPGDKDFWKNSSAHFYSEHVDELKALHPAFFSAKIPKGSENSYVKAVHGEVLETLLSQAEGSGWEFEMLHPTYTETLLKRYRGE